MEIRGQINSPSMIFIQVPESHSKIIIENYLKKKQKQKQNYSSALRTIYTDAKWLNVTCAHLWAVNKCGIKNSKSTCIALTDVLHWTAGFHGGKAAFISLHNKWSSTGKLNQKDPQRHRGHPEEKPLLGTTLGISELCADSWETIVRQSKWPFQSWFVLLTWTQDNKPAFAYI